jgi:ankyrin repeat protein
MYQDSKDEYIRIVNSQTAEGYTPLMVTIIHQAQNTLQLLLHLGGSDLYIIEASKLRAYDLAINYHNDKAIQQLIGY